MVGKGGYAQVFKGVLANGEVIAVKKLTRESEELKERDFLTELGIIGHVCHRNTSMLIGFCIERGLHLVYKYSPHGSVAAVLHGKLFVVDMRIHSCWCIPLIFYSASNGTPFHFVR